MKTRPAATRFAGPVLGFLLLAGLAAWLSDGQRGWTVAPDFAGKKARFEISGAACAPEFCLAVNDETNRAQMFTVEGRTLVPGRTIRLSNDESEIDAEAVAYADGYFYVTGSHGLSRKKAKLRPSQFQIMRIAEDGTVKYSHRLRPVLRSLFPDHAEQPLDRNGLTIEGLTARDGHLYFGFRAPVMRGAAAVIDISIDALFGDAKIYPRQHSIPLGDGIGIRDMIAVDDGFLLLTGPVGDDPPIYRIVAWQPGAEPETLYTVPRSVEGKPETLLHLGSTADALQLLILRDGIENGGPIAVDVPGPTRTR